MAICFISVLILCLIPKPSFSSVLLDRVVAVVNKEVITWSELYMMMEQEATEKIKSLSEEEKRKIFKENESMFLEKLIDLRLQLQEARRLEFSITPEEVDLAIENIKRKYSMSDSDLENHLKKEGMSLEEYKKRLSDQMLLTQLVNRQIRSKIVISEQELKDFMSANSEKYGIGDGFKIRQIFWKMPKDEAEKNLIEDKASAVIQRLEMGEDFSELARQNSEDLSAKSGGNLGFIRKDILAQEFIDVLSTMKQGDYSSPFWTEKGLHIIQLQEKLSIDDMTEMKETIRKQLADAKFLEQYKNWLKGLREKARIEVRL
jgi:peptidyl-prolyl cis-trans isomerase SurA